MRFTSNVTREKKKITVFQKMKFLIFTIFVMWTIVPIKSFRYDQRHSLPGKKNIISEKTLLGVNFLIIGV